MPCISVIVPVYQDPDGICACLHALEQQTIPLDQFEVIVVDNGSDPPVSVPDSCQLDVSLVRCETLGSYAARNAGVHAARGEYLAFTDADCIPDCHWLETGIEALQTHGPDTVIGGEVRFSLPAKQTAVSLYQTSVGFQQRENINAKGFSATACLFCTSVAFDRADPFDERLLSGGDREWAWRAKRAGIRVAFAPGAIVETLPRTTLRGAIRQARRITAGRYHLKQTGLATGNDSALSRHRGPLASALWILRNPQLGLIDRVRVFAVASIIALTSAIESVRLRLGATAERR